MTRDRKLELIWANCPYFKGIDIYALGVQNGMGPDTWKGRLWRPIQETLNHAFGLYNVEWIGDVHDTLYYLGGGIADRRFADNELLRLMRGTCPLTPLHIMKWWSMRCVSSLFYKAVHYEGGEYFSYRSIKLLIGGSNEESLSVS